MTLIELYYTHSFNISKLKIIITNYNAADLQNVILIKLNIIKLK